MFKRLRRLWELWKRSLFDSYDPKPTVYKVGNKRYIKVKRFRTKSRNQGPYLK